MNWQINMHSRNLPPHSNQNDKWAIKNSYGKLCLSQMEREMEKIKTVQTNLNLNLIYFHLLLVKQYNKIEIARQLGKLNERSGSVKKSLGVL